MQTVLDVMRAADRRLLAGDAHGALPAYCAILRLQPAHLDARLRIGDALLALGEVQNAALVYTAVARYATHAGYPLRALVALKVLAALEPQLAQLLDPLAHLYCKGSERLGRGVRPAPGEPEQEVPADLALEPGGSREEIVAAASAIGSDTRNAAYPQRLPPIPLFSTLGPEAFAGVLHALKLRRLRADEVIVREGDSGQSFFVIARGTVRVVKAQQDSEIELARLHAGALFGEMALVSAAPRTATVVATEDTDVLEFDRDALAALSRDVEAVAVALDGFTRERLLLNLMQTSPLFRPLERAQRMDLVRRFAAHDVAAGTPIIVEGQTGKGLFVLLAGEADVSKRDGNSKVLLATLKPGDVFGEIALIHDEPATASVTAARSSTVLFLARDVFDKLIAAFPAIRDYVEQLGDERQMDTRILMESAVDAEELSDEELVFV